MIVLIISLQMITSLSVVFLSAFHSVSAVSVCFSPDQLRCAASLRTTELLPTPLNSPETTVAKDIRKELEAVAEFTGSDQERQARIFCSQLGINYDNLYPEEFAALVNILKKSKFLKSPLSKRGKTGTKKRKR